MKSARDITIRHCTLRVMRRGGWSWGADSQTLTRRAIERLPALLERRLDMFGDALPDDLEIAQPLSLHLVLRKQEWADLLGGREPSEHLRARMEAAVDAAMSQALPAMLSARVHESMNSADGSSTVPAGETRVAPSDATAATQPRISPLWKLLLQMRAEGSLLTQLTPLSEVVLKMWLNRLVDIAPEDIPVAPDDVSLRDLRSEILALPLLMPAGPARTLVRQVVLVVELKARWSLRGTQTRALLASLRVDDEPATVDAPSTPAQPADPAGDEVPPAAGISLLTIDPPVVKARGAAAPVGDFELDIPCALPFLLLTPLARSGYLTTLAAALDAANAGSLAGGVALGLAHKCLAAPQRGWLREAGALGAAAAFAGEPTYDNEPILNAGRALRAQLAVLDSSLAGQLIRGHRADAGWLLASDASGALMLFDEDGLVPVATGTLASLAARIAPTGGVLFVSAQAASTEHLDALDDLQIPYASGANLASRRSATSFIATDGSRLWTSTHGAQQGRARGLAERGTELCMAALANWAAVHDERPAQRPGIDPAFETSLSLAAGFALSAIAWTLWRQRARATALTAIESFADLDARVRLTRERVHVTLPMGRRAWDLRDHGLLAEVREVPWLGGRTVIFGVG